MKLLSFFTILFCPLLILGSFPKSWSDPTRIILSLGHTTDKEKIRQFKQFIENFVNEIKLEKYFSKIPPCSSYFQQAVNGPRIQHALSGIYPLPSSTNAPIRIAPLQAACDLNNGPIIKILLKAGANPNYTVNQDRTPLLSLVHHNAVDSIKLLLKHGANPNDSNLRFETPLHISCSYGLEEVTTLLLDAGADPFQQTFWDSEDYVTPFEVCWISGNTQLARLILKKIKPLPNISYFRILYLTCRHSPDPYEPAKVLLDAGVNPNDPEIGSEDLFSKALQKCNIELVALLLHHKIMIPESPSDEHPIFFFRHSYDNAAIIPLVAMLLNYGISLETRTLTGNTVLMEALDQQELSLLHFLLIAGANSNARNNKGETSLHICAKNGYSRQLQTILTYAQYIKKADGSLIKNNLYQQYPNVEMPDDW